MRFVEAWKALEIGMERVDGSVGEGDSMPVRLREQRRLGRRVENEVLPAEDLGDVRVDVIVVVVKLRL